MRVLLFLLFFNLGIFTCHALDFTTLLTFTTKGADEIVLERSPEFGDLNGDGQDDILFGTYNVFDREVALHIFYCGQHPGADGDIWPAELSTADADVELVSFGENNYRALWPRGDLDGDGSDDIVLVSNSEVFIFYSQNLRSFTTPSQADLTIESADKPMRFLSAVVGDVNGDQQADIIVSGTSRGLGYIFVFYNEILTPFVDVTAADLTISSSEMEDKFGYQVDLMSDVSGDGRPELVVSAPNSQGKGAVFMYYRPYQAGKLNARDAADVVFNGESRQDMFGRMFRTVPDMDGDQQTDILIGAPGFDRDWPNGGCVYFFRGSEFWETMTHQEAHAQFVGGSEGEQFGEGFTSLQFHDGQKAGLVIGSLGGVTALENSAGQLYFFGQQQLSGDVKAQSARTTIQGQYDDIWYKPDLNPAGDINRDGTSDFFVIAHRQNAAGKTESVLLIMTME